MKHESVNGLLSALVRVPSVNGHITGNPLAEEKLGLYLKETAEGMGLKTRLLEISGSAPNLLITREFDAKAPWLLAAAHMDTVSAEGMAFDPFCGEEKDGRVLGRGACDDKGCIASLLWALKEIRGSACPNNIALLFSVDEEQKRGGATAFVKQHLPLLGFVPKGVIVAEPTSLKPIVAHAGIGHFKVTARGIAAHASAPSKGRSAIKDMVKVIEALESRYIAGLSATDPLCGSAQCSINMISGGRQVNAVPDECVIRVDRRVMPSEDINAVIPAVRKILDELAAENPGMELEVEQEFMDNPLAQDIDSPFIKWMLTSLYSLGLDAAPRGAQFATDAGAFSSAGLACVVLGPGDASLAHTAAESVSVAELKQGADVFRHLFMSRIDK